MVRKSAYALGVEGERAAGITGPKRPIPSVNGTADFRVPDFVDHDAKILVESKNVARLSYTRQLRDYVAYAKKYGYTFYLWVRPNDGTRLSGPLNAAKERGDFVLREFP